MKSQKTKIGIIGGCGHIGLPLGIVLSSVGYDVTLYDINENAVRLVNDGIVPFLEEGAADALKSEIQEGNLRAKPNDASISDQSVLFVTIGTPVDEHQSPVPRVFLDFYKSIESYLKPGQLIVLRSTVFPGTSEWLAKKLAPLDIGLAFCPERIVQGKAISELKKLPQITSATDEKSLRTVDEIFLKFAPKVTHATLAEAEFAKLFTNAYRYIQFAATNQFFMMAHTAGIDYAEVRRIMTDDYERAAGFPIPGLAAGPCLLKDTQQLLAFGQNQFNIGNAAILANEGLALYLVSIAESKLDLSNSTVGILGMAFKAESDDIRSSLSYRVRKMLQLKAKSVLSSDPFVTNDSSLLPLDEVVSKSDLIILCAAHGIYKDLDFQGKKVIDIWNMKNEGLVF